MRKTFTFVRTGRMFSVLIILIAFIRIIGIWSRRFNLIFVSSSVMILLNKHVPLLTSLTVPAKCNSCLRSNQNDHILSNLSNSALTILHHNFLNCFEVFIGLLTPRPGIAIRILSVFFAELAPLVKISFGR